MTPTKLTGRAVLALVFIVISLTSLGVILFEASNYDNYYWQGRSAILNPASNNTQVNAVRVTKNPGTGQIVVRITASATNPSNYWGFTLEAFDLNLFFIHAGHLNESIFLPLDQQLLVNARPDRPMDPRSTVTTDLVLTLTSAQASSYQMFNQTYTGNVDAYTVIVTLVNSFLDPVYGPITTQKQQEIPVS